MNSKHGISLVIRSNDDQNDALVKVTFDYDGKLIIETDYHGDVEIRKGAIRSGLGDGPHITMGGCSAPSEEMIRNCNINC